jgi:methyl-accepting chemotaxis protein
LRLWKKDQHKSDDLSSFRNTVATISSGSHQPITGVEIGRGGFAIRGIAPVIADNGTFLGSVESLSTYDPLVKYSISNDKEYIAVYMNKEYLPIATRLQNASR